jgi:hypothetical protein
VGLARSRDVAWSRSSAATSCVVSGLSAGFGLRWSSYSDPVLAHVHRRVSFGGSREGAGTPMSASVAGRRARRRAARAARGGARRSERSRRAGRGSCSIEVVGARCLRASQPQPSRIVNHLPVGMWLACTRRATMIAVRDIGGRAVWSPKSPLGDSSATATGQA